ncbi:tetratricopeptide repeat protein [Vreelandella songnenensis]|uniref:Tetratricopeptide repeat protein n=1 Tax=Vreelandella songnenensis TaxID=1176243 RepID=A0A2T0V858_9GAMM|nr:tetratricopeptide repeat protein [Halomonas songnenensis]PRY66334.1 tetratricopeptide repeat protein [Halomonas songnenensis]
MKKLNKIIISNAQEAYINREWAVVAPLYDELSQKGCQLPEKNKVQWVISLKKIQDYSSALRLISLFLSMNNTSSIGLWLFHSGECKQSLGEYSQAIDCYEKALASYQNKKTIFYRLSQCHEKLRDYKSALICIEQASSLSQSLLINAQLASVHYKQKNWSACAKVFEELFERFSIESFRPQWVYCYADSL